MSVKKNTLGISGSDAMWAAVDRAKKETFGEILHTRPPNSVTAKEYGERYSLSSEVARSQLEKLKKAGSMKRAMVLISDARGHVKPTVVYVITNQL